jgi:hypothetical protein
MEIAVKMAEMSSEGRGRRRGDSPAASIMGERRPLETAKARDPQSDDVLPHHHSCCPPCPPTSPRPTDAAAPARATAAHICSDPRGTDQAQTDPLGRRRPKPQRLPMRGSPIVSLNHQEKPVRGARRRRTRTCHHARDGRVHHSSPAPPLEVHRHSGEVSSGKEEAEEGRRLQWW